MAIMNMNYDANLICFSCTFPRPIRNTQTHPRSHTLRCNTQRNVCAPDVACTYGLHCIVVAVQIVTFVRLLSSPSPYHIN